MEDNSLDLTGAGKLAKAIPAKAWTRLVDTACDAFEKCLAPITETTGGIGRLIAAKFDRLVDAEKIMTAETFQKASEKIKKAKREPKGNYKPGIIVKVIEEASKQTDVNIRELWANLLAQEILDGSIHPEVVSILARINADDAQTLARIAEDAPKNEHTKAFVTSYTNSISLGIAGIKLSVQMRPRFTFSEKLLESLNLIERSDNKWVLTPIGEGFIESVTEPKEN
ncbi:MAG: Abi-alpha family protein [Pseudomonadota bacterium]